MAVAWRCRWRQPMPTVPARSRRRRGPNGEPVVIVGSDNKTVFRFRHAYARREVEHAGAASLGRQARLRDGQRSRVFESPADAYDEFVAALDDDYTQFIYTHESPTVDSGRVAARCQGRDEQEADARNVDVGPRSDAARSTSAFQVTRPRDGIKFWVDVTLPKDWRRARGFRASSGSIRASTRRRRSTIVRASRRTSTSSPRFRRRVRRRRPRFGSRRGTRSSSPTVRSSATPAG